MIARPPPPPPAPALVPSLPNASAQFRREVEKAKTIAPKNVDGPNSPSTRFGEMYEELPDNVAQLDAVIDVLADDLANTVDNPQVVQKHEKVSPVVVVAGLGVGREGEGGVGWGVWSFFSFF